MTISLIIILGSIVIRFDDVADTDFYEYMKRWSPWTQPNDPWLGGLWEDMFSCSLSNDTVTPSCDQSTEFTSSRSYFFSVITSRYLDAVYVIAHAIEKYIDELCPNARGYREEIKQCVKPEILSKYINEVDITRQSGHIKFDNNQESMRKYKFKQVQFSEKIGRHILLDIGAFMPGDEILQVDYSALKWGENIPKVSYSFVLFQKQ